MHTNNNHLISSKNIGLEIECPFNFYFPDVAKKHLHGKSYATLSAAEKQLFTADIGITEPALVEKLQTISNELGLLRGVDRYRECVYPATTQLHTHIHKTQRLIAENLLPYNRPLSTHITVGNISRTHAYALLTHLEQKFLTKKRLGEALTNNWQLKGGRGKGQGGIVYKDATQLAYGDKSACELRTLKIPMNRLSDCLSECKILLDQDEKELIQNAKNIVLAMGLSWKPWNRDDIYKYRVQGNFSEIL